MISRVQGICGEGAGDCGEETGEKLLSLDNKRTVPNKGTVSQVCGYLKVSSDKTLNFEYKVSLGYVERPSIKSQNKTKNKVSLSLSSKCRWWV